jgi:adenylate cyclase
VRLTAGEDSCPSAESDEQATLERIGAANDVRLACQLRPLGDIAVVPLVRTGLPVYQPPSHQQNVDREVVVMSCDFLNREELAREEMPQDLLYVLKLYAETLAEAIRAAGGTLTSVGPGGVLALFGLDHEPVRAARHSLQAAAEIARAISDLGSRMGREHHRQLRVAVTIHAGRAALAELGSSDPPAFMAVGEAVDVTNELRKLAAAHDKPFAVSEPVTTAVGVDMAPGEKLVVGSQAGGSIAAVLSEAPPLVPPPARARLSHHHAAWRRLWGG